MSKIKIILLLLWAAVAASAQETEEPDTFQVDTIDVALPWPRNIQYRLDSLLRHPMFETSTVGLEVYDLTADSILYKVNEHQMLRPASTMKLLTAITAIDKLGGSYQFRTQLYYTGKVEDHTLTGDLYCVGGFDPRFNIDDMNAFVESIRCMGVDTIRGSIVADRSMKDADLLGEGWCWDDDNPPLSPLTIGRNTQFVDRFIRQLVDDGVVLDVRISDGTLPDSAFHLCSRFHSIDQILLRMMKQSDNFYAEAMFYQLAAHQGHRPARAKDAAAIVKRLISKVGLGHRPYRIADGSGLSLYNYLSADLECASCAMPTATARSISIFCPRSLWRAAMAPCATACAARLPPTMSRQRPEHSKAYRHWLAIAPLPTTIACVSPSSTKVSCTPATHDDSKTESAMHFVHLDDTQRDTYAYTKDCRR